MEIYPMLKTKKFLIGFFVGLFIILGSFLYFTPGTNNSFIAFFSNIVPEVVGGNFDLGYKKLPVSSKYIDFTFNTDLDKTTINKQNLTISPKIDGDIQLIGNNTIRYTFLGKNEIGKQVEFTFKKEIKSIKGENLKSDTNYLINITDDARVVKIIPEKNLDNLSQNIVVFFNIPIVPITNLDNRDLLPCPIEITPKIEGKCSWTTTSVLEFIPATHFEGATKYNVKVINKEGLLYPLNETKEISFETTYLKTFVNQESPKDGINIAFNFDVNFEDLKSKLTIYDGYIQNPNEKKRSYQKLISESTKLDFELILNKENSINSNSNFTIKLKNKEFSYSKSYSVFVSKGLRPKNGNIPTSSDFSKNITFKPFLTGVTPYRNIISSTGTIVDNQPYNSWYYNSNLNSSISEVFDSGKIPTKNLFLNVSFDEEVDLNNNLIELLDKKTGKKINTKLSYVKEEIRDEKTNTGKVVENKKLLKIDVLQTLENGSQYDLKINKLANKYLNNDFKYILKTSSKLKVLDYKLVNYGKICFYLNNQINDVYNKSGDYLITTTPKSRTAYLNEYDDIPYEIQNLSKKELAKRGYCKADTGDNLYVLKTKLNPNSTYNIKLNIFEDTYGNKFEDNFEKEFKTGNINENDKQLYNSVNNDKQVIPANLPINLNLQTIHLDSVDLEVCEMDMEDYKYYLTYRWEQYFVPKCHKTVRKKLEVKNKNWFVSNNVFDLEKDVLGTKFSQNFILARGYKNGVKSFSTLYLRNDYNIVFEDGKDKAIVFITDMLGNQINNASLSFFKYDYKSKSYFEVKPKVLFNTTKKTFEIIGYKYSDFDLILAKSSDNKSGILNIGEDSFGNYDFKYISGSDTSETNYLYLFTERPIYKPGDTVYFKGILRYFTPNGYVKSGIKSGKVEVLDSNYKMIKTIDIKVDNNSNFDGKFTIPSEVSLGKFSFRFITNGNQINNNAYFHIEEYVKPVFKIGIEKIKKDFSIGEKSSFILKPEYYFGGKVTNTIGKYNVLSQDYFFDSKEYSQYQFGEGQSYFDCIYWGYCNYSDNLEDDKSFNISPNGDVNIDYSFINKPGEKLYTFNFEVTDPDTKKTVNKSDSVVLHTTDAYVGLYSPYFVGKNEILLANSIVLDYEAKPILNKSVKLDLVKTTWQVVKKQGVDGVFYDDYSMDEKLEASINLTSNSKGEISAKFKPKTSGEYLLKATYTGENGKSFISSKSIYVGGDDYIEWNNGNNTVTDLVAEKQRLKVGDKANYILKSPVNNGKALILIEKDDGILDYFIHDIKSYSDKITINVLPNYYPNYYVKVFLIGKQDKNPLPVYKRALSTTKVDTEFKNLNIAIKTNKKNYNPGEGVDLAVIVLDSNKKPVANANVFVSVVDESVLALMGNPKKNPYAFFYDMKRYLGVTTYSTLKFLIEKLEVKDTSAGEKGGAGDKVKGGDTKKKRGRFEDTAFLRANLVTDANGVARTTIKELPDNLTTWTIEAIANTHDTKVGIAYESIVTSKLIQISDNLPNFLVSKDKIIFSPVVFNKTGKAGSFKVSLTGSNLEIIDGNTKNIFLGKDEQKTVNFEAKITDIGVLGDINKAISKINLFACLDGPLCYSDGPSDEIEKVLQIKENSTLESVSTTGKTKDIAFSQNISLSGLKNKVGNLTLNYSSTILSNLLTGIEYLNNFPYGCSEQKTSAIMPNIFIKSLYNSAKVDFDLKTKMVNYYDNTDKIIKEKSVDEVIKDYLVDIRSYQKLDGGFVYFKDSFGPNYSDFHLSSYILEAGALIKNIGYKLEETVYFNDITYLKNRFYKNQIEGCIIQKNYDCKYREIDRLNALDSILTYSANDYEVYKMYKILDFKEFSTSENLKKVVLIGKLLKLDISEDEKSGLQKDAKDIIDKIISEELVYNPRGAYIGKSMSYSRLENTTLLIDAISSVGIEKFKDIDTIIDNLNRWIISQKVNGSFGSTYDNMKVIKSLTSYLNSSKELTSVNMYSKFKINNELIDEKTINDKNKLDIFSKILSISNLKDENTFDIEKSGSGNIYYDLNLNYYLDTKDIKSRDEGFSITREYYDYEEYKKILYEKKLEWNKYLENAISYDDLKYPKDVYSYIQPVKDGKVGELLIVKNKIITTETRDKVAFEGFIPSGSELVNPNLDTSTKTVREVGDNNLFNKIEYRIDRYFAYADKIYAGIYDFDYVIRLTYAGDFNIRPSKISEFYNTEVFGRTAGEVFNIEK